jgi:hypothetical protein
VKVETKFCLSRELCFIDSDYEYKPTFMSGLKEYGIVGGILLVVIKLVGL